MQAPALAVRQCIYAEGGLSQGITQRAKGRFLGGEQVYQRLAESTPSQVDHLGMESPLPRSVTCRESESAAQLKMPSM